MQSNLVFSLTLAPEGQQTLLTFSGFPNDFGIIYRISAVLYFHDLSIYRIHAETMADETVNDTFLIDAPFENVSILQKSLESDLQRLFTKEIAVLSYIAENESKMKTLRSRRTGDHNRRIEIGPCMDSNFTQIVIETQDKTGLILEVTQVLYLLYIDIASTDTQTENNDVRIKIRARRENGESLNDSIRERLQETLFKVI